MTMFYLSFATTTEFLGATVVDANSEEDAFAVATSKGLNPGGESAIMAIPPDLTELELQEIYSYKDRLVTKEELYSNGALNVSDLSSEAQKRLDDTAAIICEDCNQVKLHP